MTLEMILTRRSIRKFTGESISDEDVQEILRAAMHAPSAGNQQPWHFCIVRKRELLTAVADLHPHAQMLREAPLAVLVCGDPSLERHAGYWVQDCSAATQNTLLAIHAKGLGGVWLAIYPKEDRVQGLRKLLQIPSDIIPFSLVALGHPADKPAPVDRFNPDRIHCDGW